MSREKPETRNTPEKHPSETERFSARELWEKPEVLSLSFWRHGQWGRENPPRVPRGSIDPEGFGLIKDTAEAWLENVKELTGNPNVDISIGESPSVMPDSDWRKDRDYKRGKDVASMRASQTASIFERIITGKNPEPSGEKITGKGPLLEGHPIPKNRERKPLIGDYMESIEDLREGESIEDMVARIQTHIGEFFKMKSDAYSSNEEFTDALISGNLTKEVADALDALGGSDSKALAKRFLEQLNIEHQRNKDGVGDKKVGINISHEETLRAFLFQVAKYKQEEDPDINPEQIASAIGYVEGFDVHIDKDGLATVVRGEDVLSFELDELKEFLED